MNYQHDFHAGNFADVLKHGVLADLIARGVKAGGALSVIDTHAGAGWYDLSSPEALRGGEVRHGAMRIYRHASLPKVLLPYFTVLKALNPEGALLRYPGSPLIALHLMRRQSQGDDTLIAVERNPPVHLALKAALAGDKRARVIRGDGFAELPKLVPPTTPHLITLVDPPFELQADYERAGSAVAAARKTFPEGTYVIWMPDKGGDSVATCARIVAAAGTTRARTHLLRLSVRSQIDGAGGLSAMALIIANGPKAFIDDWTRDLPAIAELLRQGKGYSASLVEVGGKREGPAKKRTPR